MKYITSKEFVGLSPISVVHKEHVKPEIPKSAYQNVHLVFRKTVTVADPANTLLKITADDYYKLYINGNFVAMGPAPSYPNHRNYNLLELSDCLKVGENRIAVHVYYQGLLNRAYDSADNRCALGFELTENGKLLCEADESWTYCSDLHYATSGKAGYDTQFLEDLDFTLYDPAIYTGEAEGLQACVIDADYALADQAVTPIAVDTLLPAKVTVVSHDEVFVDFGREYVGYPLLTLAGEKGSKVTVICSEETEQDNDLRARAKMRCNCNYTETLTLSGGTDITDFYEYKAFRYMTVEGVHAASVLRDVKLLARHAVYENKGAKLTDGEPLLRDIWNLCEHTAHFATQEGYLDCPTREKGQYLGDFTTSGLAQLYLSGDPTMYKKTLMDFAESAEICPGLMAVYPGSLMQEIADFSLQYPLQVLNYYRYTGDRETVKALFPILCGLMAHFKQFARAEDGLLVGVTDKWNLVDWPDNLRDGYDLKIPNPIAPDAFHNVVNGFYIGAHKCMEQLAEAVGEDWEKQSDALADAFNKVFYNRALGRYVDTATSTHSALHSSILPAFYGFALPESREGILATIKEKQLWCGVQFSYFVLGACAALGAYDLEYALITSHGEHSWFNMLKEGATTLFEAWGKDQKWNTSLCHPWASAPIIALCQHADGMRAQGIRFTVKDFALKA